jgi:hypothetical protein
MTGVEDRARRRRAALQIAAMSPEAAEAVAAAHPDDGTIPSWLVLCRLILDYGCVATRDMPRSLEG